MNLYSSYYCSFERYDDEFTSVEKGITADHRCPLLHVSYILYTKSDSWLKFYLRFVLSIPWSETWWISNNTNILSELSMNASFEAITYFSFIMNSEFDGLNYIQNRGRDTWTWLPQAKLSRITTLLSINDLMLFRLLLLYLFLPFCSLNCWAKYSSILIWCSHLKCHLINLFKVFLDHGMSTQLIYIHFLDLRCLPCLQLIHSFFKILIRKAEFNNSLWKYLK